MGARAAVDLPRDWLASAPRVERVTTGRGGADVFRLHEAGRCDYVKAATGALCAELRLEADKLVWLHAHGAPVARLLDVFDDHGLVALRLEGLPGAPATQAQLAPDIVARRVAQGLRRFHDVPASDWPFGSADAARLAAAGVSLRRQFGWRLRPARRTLARLAVARPGDARSPVIVHGDADLANAIVPPAGTAAWIDCGAAGLADRYLDLYETAFAIDARFGEEAVTAFFGAYGLAAPDHVALAHYRALDDFF